jgi:hypothetical protein
MPLLSRLAASSAKGFGMYGLVVPYTADYLVVAGGGGGGGAVDGVGVGGRGGAGGLLTSSVILTKGQVYTATVGAGGGAGSGYTNGTNGGNSQFSGSGITTILSYGGGYGGSTNKVGGNGGSGGGAAGYVSANLSGGTGISGQGFAGGNNGAAGGPNGFSGGGGGAGGPGGSSVYGTFGDYGLGVYSSITGTPVYYAVGGLGYASTPNLGYGADSIVGGVGGSGVVIISVPTRYYTGTTTGSPTVTTNGLNTVIKFTSSGTYTA